MKVWGVYDDEIRELAHEVGLRILGEWDHDPRFAENIRRLRESYPSWNPSRIRREGNAYRFRLALRERLPTGELKFQKLGYRNRRTSGVCWHGHRAFLFALFRNFPEARVQTMLADYRGREDFLSRYAVTRGRGGWNLSANQQCVCPTGRVRPRVETTLERLIREWTERREHQWTAGTATNAWDIQWTSVTPGTETQP